MPNQPKKILIAEDGKPMAKAMELKLKRAGFAPTVVYNGEEVIAKVKEEQFDLILLDLIMPKLDGFGTLQQLKDLGNTTPVIVSSNLSQDEDFKRAKELGAKEFFIKSNTPIAKIVEQVEHFFN